MIMNNCTPHCFICQIPISDTNCRVIIIPKVIGTKSPMRLIDGVNSIGNANNTNTMAITVITLMLLGLITTAINLFLLLLPDLIVKRHKPE